MKNSVVALMDNTPIHRNVEFIFPNHHVCKLPMLKGISVFNYLKARVKRLLRIPEILNRNLAQQNLPLIMYRTNVLRNIVEKILCY